LSGCRSIEEVQRRMQTRINSYVRFLRRNYRMLDGGIRRSKTDMGTSLSVVVAEPKRAGVLKEQVSVFIHVDHYEELANISSPDARTPDYV
jgi:hypothetical protein